MHQRSEMAKTILTSIVSIVLLGFTSVSYAERTHKIKLLGLKNSSAPEKLTVELLTQDFTNLAKVTNAVSSVASDEYEGVLFQDLVKKYAHSDVNQVTLIATDNYKVTLPLEKITKEKGVLVYLFEGKTLSRKNKGTFRLVFDLENVPSAEKNWYGGASIWSINRIIFESE